MNWNRRDTQARRYAHRHENRRPKRAKPESDSGFAIFSRRLTANAPKEQQGLQIKSYEHGDEVVAEWTPESHHEAYDGMLNGGIIGTLLDCHSNWTAAIYLMRKRGDDKPPRAVTAEYTIKLKRPTPSSGPVRLRARVVESTDDRATVEASLQAGGKVCATCRGVFIAVKPDHPAYQRTTSLG